MKTFWGAKLKPRELGSTPRQPARRSHGGVVGPPERREIERSGWRTRIEFVEQVTRSRDGTLVAVEPCWTAEAHRFEGEIMLAVSSGPTAEDAWTGLLHQIRRGDVTHHRRVKFA